MSDEAQVLLLLFEVKFGGVRVEYMVHMARIIGLG